MVGPCPEFHSTKCEWVPRMLCWSHFHYAPSGTSNFGTPVSLTNMLSVFHSIDALMTRSSMGCASLWFLKLKWTCTMHANNRDNKVVPMWVLAVLHTGTQLFHLCSKRGLDLYSWTNSYHAALRHYLACKWLPVQVRTLFCHTPRQPMYSTLVQNKTLMWRFSNPHTCLQAS